ncbi:WD repeat and FYVE domain-containing 3 [Brachionus plicatilis]|uniref:WD repeat and FYVE domain-containing 3 n=1 Tax=Brachionus plicatilis TaxID=10195 RepID=A0A3M7PVN6_BRAPC|nr:WD repeat and FYVE domain-containing 3 [Brachionus plicatilis]
MRVLSNTAMQLQGASRTVGGVVTGYVGVRLFQPMPMSKSVESLGGAGFLLALVAMATDVSPLSVSPVSSSQTPTYTKRWSECTAISCWSCSTSEKKRSSKGLKMLKKPENLAREFCTYRILYFQKNSIINYTSFLQ